MNVRALILGLLLAVPALPVLAQGFADMGRAVDGFALPQPGPFTFPADHGAHPDFRIEWWYLTASLTGPDGIPFSAYREFLKEDSSIAVTLCAVALVMGSGTLP